MSFCRLRSSSSDSACPSLDSEGKALLGLLADTLLLGKGDFLPLAEDLQLVLQLGYFGSHGLQPLFDEFLLAVVIGRRALDAVLHERDALADLLADLLVRLAGFADLGVGDPEERLSLADVLALPHSMPETWPGAGEVTRNRPFSGMTSPCTVALLV